MKSSAQNENNAAKTLALDHLGIIAARLRTSPRQGANNDSPETVLQSLDEVASEHYRDISALTIYQITSKLDIQALESLMNAHQDVFFYLARRATEDQAYNVRCVVDYETHAHGLSQSARELGAVIWGQELASALKHASSLLEDACDEESAKSDKKVRAFGAKLKNALSIVWRESDTDVFESRCAILLHTSPASDVWRSNPQGETVRIDRLAEAIGGVQILKAYFNPVLNVVLQALDAPPVFMRTKALKALGQIITSDPSILAAVCVYLRIIWSRFTVNRRRTSVGLLRAIFWTAQLQCGMPRSS